MTTCPFLKQAQVKYCRVSPVRKLIPLAQASTGGERCSSRQYEDCAAFRQHPEAGEFPPSRACPFLSASLMQFCGAAAVAKFIPYNDSPLSRCGNEGYRYCELYLQMSHPAPPPRTALGIPMPAELAYSANHFWVDRGTDGCCYVGIDGFLSRVLGQVERVVPVWQKGRHRPAVVVRAGDFEAEIALPFVLDLTDCNLYLRTRPEWLANEPYTRGWLFAGARIGGEDEGMLRGRRAHDWMDEEVRRLHEFLQHLPGPAGATAADGGMFAAGLVQTLARESSFALFEEFFSPLREPEVKP